MLHVALYEINVNTHAKMLTILTQSRNEVGSFQTTLGTFTLRCTIIFFVHKLRLQPLQDLPCLACYQISAHSLLSYT